MKNIMKITAIFLLAVVLSSCTIITRAQEDQLRDWAYRSDLKAESNDRKAELLEKNLGSDSHIVTIIKTDATTHRQTAEIIYRIVGKPNE